MEKFYRCRRVLHHVHPPWALPREHTRSFRMASRLSQTTYFQRPPPQAPKPRRRILFGTTCFLSGILVSVLFLPLLDEELLQMRAEELLAMGIPPSWEFDLRIPYPHTAESGTSRLMDGASISPIPGGMAHNVQVASNQPIEDTVICAHTLARQDQSRSWVGLGIFDGHAGNSTSEYLGAYLLNEVFAEIEQVGGLHKDYVPNDPTILEAIKKAFLYLDESIMTSAPALIKANEPRAKIVAHSTVAMSGSCALLALFDPVNSVLRIANVGDSRAVLGRWDKRQGKYVAVALSYDHTGFNADEVARLQAAHPGEDVIDPKDGRLFGLAVTRAFGDSRWKWPASITQNVYEKFWGPRPRPNGVIRTPPYLTAEPEVVETVVHTDSDHPDFLIMASDGFWDVFDNQDAVTCVQMWLDKYSPRQILTVAERKAKEANAKDSSNWLAGAVEHWKRNDPFSRPSYSKTPDNEDTFFDESEGCLRWHVKPSHFVVEDEHCGVHLAKNALGGNRRALFEGLMTLKAPLARNVRDDISIMVTFFDGTEKIESS